jgi:hypothetical protein
MPRALGRSAGVGGDEMQLGMPLRRVSRGGDRDDHPGPCVAFAARVADQLLDRLGSCAGKLTEQLPPAAEQRARQAWDGQHHMAVRDGPHFRNSRRERVTFRRNSGDSRARLGL